MAEIIEEIVTLMTTRAQIEGDGWMRTQDIMQALHISNKLALSYLKRLNEEGRLEVSYRPMRAITGTETRVPAYRLKTNGESHQD